MVVLLTLFMIRAILTAF